MRVMAGVLVLTLCLNATSYVVVFQRERIYIGADGRRVDYTSGNGMSVCKVRLWKDTVVLTYGIAGHLASGSIKAHLFATDIEAVTAVASDITQARNMLARKSESFVLGEIEALETYARNRLQITPLLLARYSVGAVLIRIGTNGPEVRAFETTITNWEKRQTKVRFASILDTWNISDPTPLAFGNAEACSQVLNEAKKSISLQIEIRTDPTSAINRILKLQSRLTPNDVGPPFTIAFLDRAGLHFVEAGVCGR
jgi:hypothetical protein